jgi:predicted nuclease of predicted toxin-antitoxin system
VPIFLIDENLPRSLAPALHAAGFEAQDVRDLGLRGRPDPEVLSLALAQSFVLITADLGFGSLLRGIPSFPGLVLARLPDEWPTDRVNEVIRMAVETIKGTDLTGTLVLLEPSRLRLHRMIHLRAV